MVDCDDNRNDMSYDIDMLTDFEVKWSDQRGNGQGKRENLNGTEQNVTNVKTEENRFSLYSRAVDPRNGYALKCCTETKRRTSFAKTKF